jgi:hypothetical protein
VVGEVGMQPLDHGWTSFIMFGGTGRVLHYGGVKPSTAEGCKP